MLIKNIHEGKRPIIAVILLILAAACLPATGATTDITADTAVDAASDKPALAKVVSGDKITRQADGIRGDEGETGAPYAENRILVRFDTDTTTISAETVSVFPGHESSPVPGVPGLFLITLPETVSVEQAIMDYTARNDVLYAEPDYRTTRNGARPGAASDPLYPLQWSHKNVGQAVKPDDWYSTSDVYFIKPSDRRGTPACDIDIESARAITTGSKDIIVAVLDTGVMYKHPDLAGNMWTNKGEIPGNEIDDDGNGYIDDFYGWDFYNDDNYPTDDDGHGTHCAGTIAAAKNGYGTVGICENVLIMPLKYLGDDGGYTSDEIRAIAYAEMMGAHIVSCSFSGETFTQAEYEAIKNSKMLFVCAAGNDGNRTETKPRYPACYDLPNIIAVASTDFDDALSDFSNYGTDVDIAAPGEDIIQTSVIWVPKEENISASDFLTLKKLPSADWFSSKNGTKTELTIAGIGNNILYEKKPTVLNGQNLLICMDTLAYLPGETDYMYSILSPVPFSNFRSVDEILESDQTDVYEWFGYSGDGYEYNDTMWLEIYADGVKDTWGTDFVYIGYYYVSSSDASEVVIRSIDKYEMTPGWSVDSGTSMAVPHVSGTAALMLSVNRDLTPAEIAEIIRQTADKKQNLYGKTTSSGRLNATSAVKEALCYPVTIPDREMAASVPKLIDHLVNGKRIDDSYDLNRDGVIDGRDLILLQHHIKTIQES